MNTIKFQLGEYVMIKDSGSAYYGETGKIAGRSDFDSGRCIYHVDLGNITILADEYQLTKDVDEMRDIHAGMSRLLSEVLNFTPDLDAPLTPEEEAEANAIVDDLLENPIDSTAGSTLPEHANNRTFPLATVNFPALDDLRKQLAQSVEPTPYALELARQERRKALRRRLDKHLSTGFDYDRVEGES